MKSYIKCYYRRKVYFRIHSFVCDNEVALKTAMAMIQMPMYQSRWDQSPWKRKQYCDASYTYCGNDNGRNVYARCPTQRVFLSKPRYLLTMSRFSARDEDDKEHQEEEIVNQAEADELEEESEEQAEEDDDEEIEDENEEMEEFEGDPELAHLTQQLNEKTDRGLYDPSQSKEERREIRLQYRKLITRTEGTVWHICMQTKISRAHKYIIQRIGRIM